LISKIWIRLRLLPLGIALLARSAAADASDPALVTSSCANAVTHSAVCIAANERALQIMREKRVEAITVIQQVDTGAVLVFAASQPSDLDVTTGVNPLSLSKLLLCASWWDNGRPDSNFDSKNPNEQNAVSPARVSVHEILVNGSDFGGKQMAVALRKSVGTKIVLQDFKRYGFGPRTISSRDNTFWNEIVTDWKPRLVPSQAYVLLSDEMSDQEWADALSIGEIGMEVTALHVSRFLQAIGNDGVMLPPVAREEQFTSSGATSTAPRREHGKSIQVMQQSTAQRLQSAMRDCVQRGTAKRIAKALENSGWKIGGKTGSGTALLPKRSQLDGWFAGLIFDRENKARFTVATFVRSGGLGGENAAMISAELARWLIEKN
jgi:cell division protein FtsI/penicillin-binding protein 2